MDSENDKNFEPKEASGLPNQEDYHDPNEVTLDDFFDKVTVKKKETPKIFLIPRDNNSGTGEEAPDSIAHKYNWGAFLFNWIWGIKYKKWSLLVILPLIFIPYGFIAAFVMALWAGAKGNQWAWEEVIYKNEEDFHKAQRAWVKWWISLASVLVLVLGIVSGFIISKKTNASVEDIIPSYSLWASKELTIPQEVYDDTRTSDKYSNFLTTGKYIIYWIKPQTDISVKNKEYIEDSFEKYKDVLADKFMLYPDLYEVKDASGNVLTIKEDIKNDSTVQGVTASCELGKDTCIEAWLYKTCDKGFCIINANDKKYYKVRGKENVVKSALKLLNKWK